MQKETVEKGKEKREERRDGLLAENILLLHA